MVPCLVTLTDSKTRRAGLSASAELPVDFIGAKDDGGGGDNWSYKACKAPVKSSPPTNHNPSFYRPDSLPVAQPTVSKH